MILVLNKWNLEDRVGGAPQHNTRSSASKMFGVSIPFIEKSEIKSPWGDSAAECVESLRIADVRIVIERGNLIWLSVLAWHSQSNGPHRLPVQRPTSDPDVGKLTDGAAGDFWTPNVESSETYNSHRVNDFDLDGCYFVPKNMVQKKCMESKWSTEHVI